MVTSWTGTWTCSFFLVMGIFFWEVTFSSETVTFFFWVMEIFQTSVWVGFYHLEVGISTSSLAGTWTSAWE